MNLDGLTLSVLCKELNTQLQSGQIQKLYQIDKHTLLFKVRANNNESSFICKQTHTGLAKRTKLLMYVFTKAYRK